MNYDIIYFIGIGGIGMSALARWFMALNYEVFGYDKTETALTKALVFEGANVHYSEDIGLIPINATPKNTLVVYTPAVPTSHKEYKYLDTNGFTIKKRAEVLGEISKKYFTIAVAGTHGKTTTTSMIAHLLTHARKEVTAFIGGIATNFNSNLVISKSTDAIAVIEADEFDRSFLKLKPNMAVITSVDADHLDIYASKEELVASFKKFADLVGVSEQEETIATSLLISQHVVGELEAQNSEVYGLKSAAITATNLVISNGCFEFDYSDGTSTIKELALQMPGYHNVENALAAIKIALALGVSVDAIRDGIGTYKGVKRRFEFVYTSDCCVYIDDYAHHPVELRSFITSVNALYPDKKLLLIFQPHLYSRTRDFAQAFAAALDQANEVWILDIYPARELPIEGVSAYSIVDCMNNLNVSVLSKPQVLKALEYASFDIVATVGAGDIDQLVPNIKEMFQKNNCHA